MSPAGFRADSHGYRRNHDASIRTNTTPQDGGSGVLRAMTDEYGRIAPWYDLLLDRFNRDLRSIGFNLFHPAEGRAVLEVGCGTGTQVAFYRDRGCRVTGIDLSPAMLQVARARLGDRTLVCRGDATIMPYPERSFDLVLATLVLHEMDPADRLAVMQGMTRVLSPEGRIGIIDYHPAAWRTVKGFWAGLLIRSIERAAGRRHYRNYRHFIANGGIPTLAGRLGLVVERQKRVSAGHIGIYRLRRTP